MNQRELSNIYNNRVQERWQSRVWRQIDDHIVWFFVLICLLILVLGVEGFLSYETFITILLSAVVYGILAIGESLCLLVGMFDLSIESTLGFTVVVSVLLFQRYDMPGYLVIPIIFVIGAAIGLLNGFFIVKLGINPFIQTLAMLVILRGLILLFTYGETLIDLPDWFRWIGTSEVFGIPVQIFILIGLYILFIILLGRTPWGRRIYAVGSNRNAAMASGVKSGNIVISAFLLSSILASLAGFIFTSRVGAVFPTVGEGWIFDVFAASVIGGISLQGGRGRLIGTLGGVIFLSIISSMIVWFSLPIMAVRALRGVIILAAVLLDALKNKVRTRLLV